MMYKIWRRPRLLKQVRFPAPLICTEIVPKQLMMSHGSYTMYLLGQAVRCCTLPISRIYSWQISIIYLFEATHVENSSIFFVQNLYWIKCNTSICLGMWHCDVWCDISICTNHNTALWICLDEWRYQAQFLYDLFQIFYNEHVK